RPAPARAAARLPVCGGSHRLRRARALAAQKGVVARQIRRYLAPVRRLGVTATFALLAVIVWPGAAMPAKVGTLRVRPGVVDLMRLRSSDHALIQVGRGRVVPGGTLVSRRLGIWRVPTTVAERIGLRL